MSGKKLKMVVALLSTVIAVIAFVNSSYAWLSLSTTPTVSDLLLNVVTNTDLLIAFDNNGEPGEWGSILNFSELPEGTVLKPTTFSASEGIFLAPKYGTGGRNDFSAPTPLTDKEGNLLVSSATADTEETIYGIIAFDVWFMTSSANCKILLSDSILRDDSGIFGSGTYVVGEPIWDEDMLAHVSGGNGAEYAVRMAFAVHPNDETEDLIIVLYEPNCDGGLGAKEPDDENDVIDYIITQTSDENGGSLEGDYKIIRQRTSGFSEKNPVLADSVTYEAGEFVGDDTTIFELKVNVARKVTIFIWLEGQDADCINAISGGRILANLQFRSDTSHHHGQDLQPE